MRQQSCEPEYNGGQKLTSLTREHENSLRNAQKAAYLAASTVLNPNKKRSITKKFSMLIGTYKLLFRKDIRPAFTPISKKDLLGVATKVTKISDELSQSMKKFFLLGMPASLAVRHIAEMQEYLLENLQILAKHLGRIQVKTKWIIWQIKELEQKRTIRPLPAVGEAFDMDLAELWVEAGHKFSSTVDGPTAVFFEHAYEAATGTERQTVTRALTNASKFIKSGMKRPTIDQIKRAARAKHTATFDKIQRDCLQGRP
jgi:hypothetical protein